MLKEKSTILIAADKFMPEMNLKQLGFTYSARGTFTKNKERIQKFGESGDTNYIYKNELHKACFQHEMAYGDFKDLPKRRASDKVLRHKVFNTAKNPKYEGYQRGLGSMVYKTVDNKAAGSGANMHANKSVLKLAEELHKPIIRKLKEKGQFILDLFIICALSMSLVNMLGLFL